MRYSIRKAILVLPFLLAAVGANAFASAPPSESYGFWSEDVLGGSYLGVDTRDISPDRIEPLHLKEERGVEVTMVDQDAPAGKAGIKEHDVILTINGNQVESVEQLRRMIHEIPAGRTVSIGISRNGQPITLKAQLADRKHAFAVAPNFNQNFKFEMSPVPPVPPMPAMPAMPDIDIPVSVVVVQSSSRSGLMVENLTAQLGDFLGAKNGRGVLVRSVEKGSRAEKAGFRAGDVIVKINGDAVTDTGDFSHSLRSVKDNNAAVGIIRDKKEQTLTLSLPERRSGYYEETFQMPEIDAETVDMSAVRSEIARVLPQVELAKRNMIIAKPVMEQVNREMQKQQGEFQKQMRLLQRDIQKQQNEIQRQFQFNLRRGLSGQKADI